MMSTEPQFERLSDYERAICYFTLPSIHKPLPSAVYIVYAMAGVAVMLSLAFSLRSDMRSWTVASVVLLILLVVGGGSLFFFRAIRMQIREREALADAEGVPNAESGFEANLDPFARHTLICRPWLRSQSGTPFWDRKGNLLYRAESPDGGPDWIVAEASGDASFTIKTSGSVSFAVSSGTPRMADVFRDDVRIAEVAQQGGWGRSRVTANLLSPGAVAYTIQNGEIQHNGGVVGRIYYIRHSAYLDIQLEHLNEATLTYFAVMT